MSSRKHNHHASTLNTTAQAGWSRPSAFAESRWHYFKAGARQSLCSRLLFTGGVREDGNDERDNACPACQELVQGIRKARKTTQQQTAR